MTQLLKMFKDAGLIRAVQQDVKERRKSISVSPDSQQRRKSMPNRRRMSLAYNPNSSSSISKLNKYETAIENCPLLMTFEQFTQFIKSLGSDSSLNSSSNCLNEILGALYQALQTEQESFLFSLHLQSNPSTTTTTTAATTSSISNSTSLNQPNQPSLILPYPLQEESVIGQDSNIFLSYSLTQSVESSGLRSSNFHATIWEKNMEQV